MNSMRSKLLRMQKIREEGIMTDRSPRTSQTREKTTSRAKPWRPPSQLDAPNPPEGICSSLDP